MKEIILDLLETVGLGKWKTEKLCLIVGNNGLWQNELVYDIPPIETSHPLC